MRPVCLIIRDGWGYNENPRANAVMAALTPNCTSYKASYPWTLLACSGEAVGLPEGYQGSSEVGHLNIGAGRIVIQELKRLDAAFASGEVFRNPKWVDLMARWKQGGGRLHLLGLLQDEGVHAHQRHLFAIMREARAEFPEGEILIHAFLDGRDTPPKSCLEYLATLDTVMSEVGGSRLATIMGRYYAMDRSRDWPLTDQAYNCTACGTGRPITDAHAAVLAAYENEKTPDGADMFDEYIPPCVLNGYGGVQDGDCVLHTNYRQDRAIQLTQAFISDSYPGARACHPAVTFLGLTRYYDEFTRYLLPPMSDGGSMDHLLGEEISNAGLRQLRIAETQKYRHVTSFINGKATTPFSGEDDVEVPSRFDPASFASHPEMDAINVTDALLSRVQQQSYAFILVNFANGDMVGHTGNLEAAKRAVEVVDQCVGRLTSYILSVDGHVLITADHGNCEQMVDYATGMPKTSHTLYPVEFVYVAKDAVSYTLREHGKLSDIAPTVLHLLGLPIPVEMTADNLLIPF